MPIPPATEVDLDALRLAYEAAEESKEAIRAAFGISKKRLVDLAREGGWTRPLKMKKPRRTVSANHHIDLEKLREAYEAGEEPMDQTCVRFGIHMSTLGYYKAKGDWRRRKRAYRKDGLTAPPQPFNAEAQQALARRLHEILG